MDAILAALAAQTEAVIGSHQLDMSVRRARGETVTETTFAGPVELVSGRALATEAAQEYRLLQEELTVAELNPFRDTSALVDVLRQRILDKAEEMAYYIEKWQGEKG
jgi:hypothetical protein